MRYCRWSNKYVNILKQKCAPCAWHKLMIHWNICDSPFLNLFWWNYEGSSLRLDTKYQHYFTIFYILTWTSTISLFRSNIFIYWIPKQTYFLGGFDKYYKYQIEQILHTHLNYFQFVRMKSLARVGHSSFIPSEYNPWSSSNKRTAIWAESNNIDPLNYLPLWELLYLLLSTLKVTLIRMAAWKHSEVISKIILGRIFLSSLAIEILRSYIKSTLLK